MYKHILVGITIVFGALQPCRLFSQGCSDAGFCTMGAMRPNQHFVKKLNVSVKSVELSQYLGITKFKDYIFATTLDVNIGIDAKTSVQFKVPYMYIMAPLGVTQGIGDISVSASRILWFNERSQVALTIGAKIPTGIPDKKDSKGKPLPMYNQVTLGTYDIVAGIAYSTRGWLFATGYQQALNDNAQNTFLWGARPSKDVGLSDSLKAAQYPVSNLLVRGNDVMFRVEKNVRFSRFNIYVGLLPIWRIQADRVFNKRQNQYEDVANSNGLALTGLIGGGYRFSYNSGIRFLAGYAIVERKVNPDGLSRDYVFSVGYEYRF